MTPIDADGMHVVGPDGMLVSMEPPLKFEEDETWDNAPSEEDPFMNFVPTDTHLPAHTCTNMSPHMGPVDVSGPDGMLDSMEAPLKFEEDETWDNAPSQEDPFMSFFPTGTHLPAH